MRIRIRLIRDRVFDKWEIGRFISILIFLFATSASVFINQSTAFL